MGVQVAEGSAVAGANHLRYSLDGGAHHPPPATQAPNPKSDQDAALVVDARSQHQDGDQDGSEALSTEAGSCSIYDLTSPRRRWCQLLIAAAASILMCFSDTAPLPALSAIQADLNTSHALVAASVAIYMAASGLGALVWGPAGDRYGRRIVYVLAGVGYAGTSVGCIFAADITQLVIFRALQGAIVAAFMTNGNSIVADLFAPEVRGRASGAFLVAFLVGAVLGPLVGGWMAEAFGWRAIFWFLLGFGAFLTLLVLLAVPETHQQHVMRRLAREQPQLAARVREGPAILAEAPVFQAPWVPLKYLFEPALAPYTLVSCLTLAVNFAALTEVPIVLAAAPYSLSQGLIGVTYLSDGLSCLTGSPIGGWVADRSAARHPDSPEARVWWGALSAFLLMPAGLLIYAWALDYRVHLAVVVFSQFTIGFACAVTLPGVFSYVTELKQANAGAAAAGVQSGQFLAAAVVIQVSAIANHALGFGIWFSILAALQFASGGLAMLAIGRRGRRALLPSVRAQPAAGGGAGGSSHGHEQ